MSAPWWHCYPLLVLTIYSQWHFRRWVGDIWLMRNRWTSSDMHYTCSFLRYSLPRSPTSLFSRAAELFLLLPFKMGGSICVLLRKSNEWLWSEPGAILENAVRKCLSYNTCLSVGSLHAVLVPTYHIPFPLQFLDSS